MMKGCRELVFGESARERRPQRLRAVAGEVGDTGARSEIPTWGIQPGRQALGGRGLRVEL